jgi:hypothetical protein
MVGRAIPAIIHIKDFSQSPHQKQYPLRPEAREGLIPIIKGLKEQGSQLNALTPITFPSGGQEGVQQMEAGSGPLVGNEAVISFHPVVPNPYTFLAQVPLVPPIIQS